MNLPKGWTRDNPLPAPPSWLTAATDADILIYHLLRAVKCLREAAAFGNGKDGSNAGMWSVAAEEAEAEIDAILERRAL